MVPQKQEHDARHRADDQADDSPPLGVILPVVEDGGQNESKA